MAGGCQISRDDLIQFESHGVSHAAMSTLTDKELFFEMKYSQDRYRATPGGPAVTSHIRLAATRALARAPPYRKRTLRFGCHHDIRKR